MATKKKVTEKAGDAKRKATKTRRANVKGRSKMDKELVKKNRAAYFVNGRPGFSMETKKKPRRKGYDCVGCGKHHIDTGEGELPTGLCLDCFTLAGHEAEHSDGLHVGKFVKGCLMCRDLRRGAVDVSAEAALERRRRREALGLPVENGKNMKREWDEPKRKKHSKRERKEKKGRASREAKPSTLNAEIIERWKKGENITALATEAGMKRNKFRRELKKALGGADQFKELRAQGAGGVHVPFGGKRREVGQPIVSDEDVPVISKASKKQGWSSRILYVGLGKEKVSQSVFIDPDGVEFVRALPSEKADLVFKLEGDRGNGLDPIRLRKFEDSSVAKKVRKHEKLEEHGAQKHAAKKAEKRHKRAIRKGQIEVEAPEPGAVAATVAPTKKISRKKPSSKKPTKKTKR